MRTTFTTFALAALALADPLPQGVTSAIAPSGTPPAECSENYNGVFQIAPVDSASKRSLGKRQDLENTDPLGITLKNGILLDPVGRTGYVASNSQFQFDAPPQAGAIYTAGFSICANGSLMIGNDATWYKCLSGTFFNLYLDNGAGQCQECYLVASKIADARGSASSVSASLTGTTGVVVTSTRVNGTSGLSTATGGTMGNGTMTGSSSGVVGAGTTKPTGTGAGKTTSTVKETTTTGGQQTTTGGQTTGGGNGNAASQTSATSTSSTGAAEAMGPVGGSFGFVAAVLALLAI
ncbi:hypothetical protein LTR09_009673 [Extremus antarcticus]|uniref:Cell wall mannoprotein PIR1-like C-terminal domain-containing protein n=1 Tax=Extremus antarcticus TaxID=702011 RepID=A0AAJ0D8H5_9PEZI|nr:hypothetical protein LTR09_009673 [Extremus antarcticus]